VAWASRRGRAGCQRRNGPLERHRCYRLAPGDGPRGTAAWPHIRPVAPCLHADAVCDCPAGAGCDSPGDIRRRLGRCDDRHNYIGVRSALRRARRARVLGHGAAVCRCIADRVRDARDLDQCLRVETDPAGISLGRVGAWRTAAVDGEPDIADRGGEPRIWADSGRWQNGR
jgi:hypothetical protein